MNYINNDVYPLIPSRGSQGVNDLNWPTHIGLALQEEWDVIYNGQRMPSKEVHKIIGMKKNTNRSVLTALPFCPTATSPKPLLLTL